MTVFPLFQLPKISNSIDIYCLQYVYTLVWFLSIAKLESISTENIRSLVFFGTNCFIKIKITIWKIKIPTFFLLKRNGYRCVIWILSMVSYPPIFHSKSNHTIVYTMGLLFISIIVNKSLQLQFAYYTTYTTIMCLAIVQYIYCKWNQGFGITQGSDWVFDLKPPPPLSFRLLL